MLCRTGLSRGVNRFIPKSCSDMNRLLQVVITWQAECGADARCRAVKMAESGGDAELEWFLDHGSFFAMESLQATLQHLEAQLRQGDVSEASSNDYCDNFCQVRLGNIFQRSKINQPPPPPSVRMSVTTCTKKCTKFSLISTFQKNCYCFTELCCVAGTFQYCSGLWQTSI